MDNRTDLSLRLGIDVVRDKTTGLRSNESIYRDKPNWMAAVTALRNRKLKKCAKIISKGVLDDDKANVVDADQLRLSDSYVAGPACVIYQLKRAENDSKDNSPNMAGTE